MTVEVLLAEPRSWTVEEIEFHLNDSSSCFDNLVNDFIRQFERMQEADKCTCSIGEARFLREATVDDLEQLCWRQE